jgi:transcriptional regulator with XRE-family HTH domain
MISYEKYATIRDSKGLTDGKVAERAGIGRSTFSDWKSGRSVPKYDKMCKIADALGMIYMELVNENGSSEGLPQDHDYLVDRPNIPGDPVVIEKAMDLYERIQKLPQDKQIALQKYLQFLQSES